LWVETGFEALDEVGIEFEKGCGLLKAGGFYVD
jgi:hypothetical protein